MSFFPTLVRIVSLALVVGLLGLPVAGFAQEDGSPAGDTIINPTGRSAEADTPVVPREQEQSVFGALTLFVVYSTLLAGAIFLGWRYLRRARMPQRLTGQGEQQLRILETKSLGRQQYLVMIAARDREVLLGVGPGFINPLTSWPPNHESATPATEDAATPATPPRFPLA